MMWFRSAEPQEVYTVAMAMRERDFNEITALRWSETRQELAESLIGSFADLENVYVAGDDEGPIAVVCYVPLRKGVWSLGMFATDRFQKVGAFLTKQIKREIIPALARAKAHRVECQSIVGYDSVHKWLKFFGLKEESVLSGFGKNGEDFKTFSWVAGRDKEVI